MKNSKLFLLSGEHIDIAKAEVASLVGRPVVLAERLLLVKTPDAKAIETDFSKKSESREPESRESDFSRLAYTSAVFQLLFKTKIKNLQRKINSFEWNKVYRKNFCVRVTHLKIPLVTSAIIPTVTSAATSAAAHSTAHKTIYSERELAGFIWPNLKAPKANLDNPETLIELFFLNDEVYCCKNIFINREQFSKRKPHLRPEHSPISLNPKLARAMVNLTGIKTAPNKKFNKKDSLSLHNKNKNKTKSKFSDSNALVIDPFCGIGGILIEAGLMGFDVVGYDIDEVNLRKAEINLKHYGIKNFRLSRQDSTKEWPCNEPCNENCREKPAKYVVADLPYGRSTKLSDNMENLYLNFIINLRRMKVKSAVITFPNNANYKKLINAVNHKKLIKCSKLKIKHEFKIYIHKSLTKNVVVLEMK